MDKKLNVLLADLVVEYHKLQNLHWYVQGKDFFMAHAKFEELYTYINVSIDEVAEHILMIEGKPLASLQAFLAVSGIKELEDNHLSTTEAFCIVKEDFTYLLKNIMEIRHVADQEDNSVIVNLLDGYSSQFTKVLWMLKQL